MNVRGYSVFFILTNIFSTFLRIPFTGFIPDTQRVHMDPQLSNEHDL